MPYLVVLGLGKGRGLNAFFSSVFYGKSNRYQCTQLIELEDWDGEQNEAPITWGEMVSDLLHIQVYGAGWNTPKGTEAACQKCLLSQFQSFLSILTNWEGWRLFNVTSIYEKDHKEDPGLSPVLKKVMELSLSGWCRTARQSSPAAMTLWKSGSTWPTQWQSDLLWQSDYL